MGDCMGFLSRKSKAAEPVAPADNGNDATKRLASVEEELKAANLKVDVLTGQLADANHNLNQVRAELERFNVAEATKQMDPNDATTELNQQKDDAGHGREGPSNQAFECSWRQRWTGPG